MRIPDDPVEIARATVDLDPAVEWSRLFDEPDRAQLRPILDSAGDAIAWTVEKDGDLTEGDREDLRRRSGSRRVVFPTPRTAIITEAPRDER